MSDTAAQHFSAPMPDGKSTGLQSATLTITLNASGKMEYSFPSNEILSYGMLEKARAKLDELALLNRVQHAQSSRGGMNGLLKRITGG